MFLDSEVIMKKINYGTFTNPPSLSFANYCDGLDAKRQGDTSRAIYEGLHLRFHITQLHVYNSYCMVLRIFHKAGNEPKFHGLNDNCNLPLKLLTKALHFIDEEELESDNAKIKKDKIYLQRAACFFIESDYQAANNDANE